jgi:hypothetical protein
MISGINPKCFRELSAKYENNQVMYVADSFLTYLFMPVVVVPVPNSYRKLGGI